MAYKVIISDEVSQAIDSIHDYITTVLLSSQSVPPFPPHQDLGSSLLS